MLRSNMRFHKLACTHLIYGIAVKTSSEYVTAMSGGVMHRGVFPIVIVSALAVCSPSQAQDQSFSSSMIRSVASSARLLSAGPADNGVYRVGVEIALDPQTITYWRQPGEAGAPPEFDFSQSINVAKADVYYPQPKHIEEAGVTVAGYEASVVFPVRITPKNIEQPVTLKLTLAYAACGKICLPAKAILSLSLPRAGRSPYAETLRAAQALVPVKITGVDSKKLIGLKKEGDSQQWSLSYTGAGKLLDVFAEAPEPLFIDTLRSTTGLSLRLFSPGRPPQGTQAILTLITDQGAFEAPVSLE